MASVFFSSILSKASQVLGFIRRWEVPPSSSSDPRSSILEDLEELERTWKRIQAVLHDAEEREIREEAVKLWLKELKEVAYDAEDVLDEYHYEVLRDHVEGQASRKRKRVEGDDEEEVSGSLSTIEVSIPDGMGVRIREIRKRFGGISEDRERLRLREEDGERRGFGALCAPPTSHMVDESSIYGREHDKQNVIDLLFSEGMGNGISVIPIVGKGGLGKTTIAQLVYNDSKVKDYFNLTGWVCISDDFDVPRLTKSIIESLTKTSCDRTQLSTLQDILKEKVKGKRVLLVLDDVWNEQQSRWESLRIPFIGAETVRIIVTCRNDSVAKIMQTVHPYHPGYLSEAESWSLFEHYAFAGRESEDRSRLADIGKQIVKKCSNLPLAVKSIGSVLRHETDEDSWREVLQSDLWELDKNNETLASLRLSYNRMPAHLKPCFIYCSMFPKDYEFDKDVLVRLWMAQGYIPRRGSKEMEDIGDECFNDLLRRSFFDSCFDYWGHSCFKMHDMMHDLAKLIAGNECYTIVDKKLPCSPDEVRHLRMEYAQKLVKPLDLYNFRALRSLFLWHGHTDPTSNHEIIKFPLLLRCLEFCWERKYETSDLFRNLKHLRYLHIESLSIKRLPESVCLLYHLQTLILHCHALVELPYGLRSLTNLRHLDIQSVFMKRLPESVCLLYHLQTLILCCARLAKLPDDLGNLINLRYFKLSSCAIERLPESVCQLRNLQTLDLQLCEQLKELPGGIGSLTNLRHLINFSDRLPDQCYTLHTLDLNGYKELKELPARAGSMRSRILYMPAGIEKLTNLQRLHGCYHVQGGMGVLKDLMNLQGDLCISGLRNLVSIEDAKDVGLKYKHKLERLYLCWDDDDRIFQQTSDNIGLCLKAFLKENKDVPANGKSEEALLEYLQPPANLKKLLIKGYGGSKFPEWVENLSSFASLKDIVIIDCEKIRSLHDSLGKLDASVPKSMLERVSVFGCPKLTSIRRLHNLRLLKKLIIYNCPQLRLLSVEELPSILQDLHIEKCQQLISLPGMQNLTSLKRLTIRNCPQLRHLSEEGLPSSLEYLYIKNYQQLTSLSGMRNLTSLRELTIQNCPKLQIMAEDQLSSKPNHVSIIDCPGLENWCQIQKINCVKVVSGNKLTVSNTWANIKHGFDELSTSTDELPQPRTHLSFHNFWTFFKETCAFVLEELTIWSCMYIPPLEPLLELTSLQRLVIKDCPGVQLLRDEQLPSMLKSLVVDSCEKLRCLQLVQQNRDALEELQIRNCPEIVMVQGLNRPSFPKFLTIEQCPQLRVSQDDCQPFIPPCAEIAGELEMKFYRPHSEETENKEMIDDGTQEKQVLNCVMIEHANSVVSSTFDAADDCNMGQFLQLGLPSGCSSHCREQNNAKPLLVDKELVAMMNYKMEDNDCNHDKNPLYDPGPSRPWQLSVAEPPVICPQQQDLVIAFPDSQPFKSIAGRSDAIMTYIDHDNSVVSPMFDDAIDCNMGQFLQLGLPSGGSSQSPMHNNAEPLD